MKKTSKEEVSNSAPVKRQQPKTPERNTAANTAATSKPVELFREPFPGDPTREIVLLRATFLPGESTPPHTHPGVLVGYVLTGELDFQLEGQPLQRFTAGDRFYEPPGSTHIVSRNPGETTTQVLAFIIRDSGARIMIPLNGLET